MAGVIGVELTGIDLNCFDDDDTASFRSLLLEHHVVVVRGQTLTPQQQIDFGHRFGELDTHPFVDGSPDHPEIIEIVTEPDDRANFGGGWHSDVTFLTEPDLGSILYGIEIPPFGGDTLFANQHAAYDALSATMQSMLEGLVATHSAGRQYGEGGQSTKSNAMSTKNAAAAANVVEHPVIRTHPESGRKGLYVNPAFTVGIKGMRRDESDALLGFCYRHAVREAFTCRVRWEPGTLVMWDNRSVQHYALHDYAGHRRHVRRITVKGDRPV
jgi:taurine dioxygenase